MPRKSCAWHMAKKESSSSGPMGTTITTGITEIKIAGPIFDSIPKYNSHLFGETKTIVFNPQDSIFNVYIFGEKENQHVKESLNHTLETQLTQLWVVLTMFGPWLPKQTCLKSSVITALDC